MDFPDLQPNSKEPFSEWFPEYILQNQTQLISSFEKSDFICFGGTFDHLHVLHKIMMSTGCLLSTGKMIVGVTGENMLKNKKYREALQPLELRLANARKFLALFSKPGTEIFVEEINDPFGDMSLEYDTLLLSQETEKAAGIMNKMRQEKGMSLFKPVVLKVLDKSQISEILGDNQSFFGDEPKISSSDIRQLIHNKFQFGEKSVLFVYEKFEKCLKLIKANPNKLVMMRIFDKIVKLYARPDRFYHCGTHISDCLVKLEELFYKRNPEIFGPEEVFKLDWATLYHDIIYDSKSKSNELDSAKLADFHLKLLGVAPAFREEVFDLIVATKEHLHAKEGSIALKSVLIDVDMSILAETREVYKKYAENIYKEYSFLGREAYVKGRTQVLKSFIEGPNIYFFKSRFCIKKANENMLFEINEMLNN